MADECVVCGEAVEGKPLYKKLGSGEFNVEVITALRALQLTCLPETAKNDNYICWDCDEVIVGEYGRYLENEKHHKAYEAKQKQVKKQHKTQQRKQRQIRNLKKQKVGGTKKKPITLSIKHPQTQSQANKNKGDKLSKTKQLELKRASNAHHSTHCVMCDSNFETMERGYQRFPLKKRVNDEMDIAQVMELLGLARHIEPKMKGRRFVCNPCFVIIRRNYKNKLTKGSSIEGSSSCTDTAPTATQNPIHRATTEEHAAEIAKLLPPALAECYKILTSDYMTKEVENDAKKVSPISRVDEVSEGVASGKVVNHNSGSECQDSCESVPDTGQCDDQETETEAEDEDSGLNVSQDEHGNYFIDMDEMSLPGSGNDRVVEANRDREAVEEKSQDAASTPRKKKNVLLPRRSHHHLSVNLGDNGKQSETHSGIEREARSPEAEDNSNKDGIPATNQELSSTGICNICGISFAGKPKDWWHTLTSPLSGFESITVTMALKLLETSLADTDKETRAAEQVCLPCYGMVSAGFRSQVVQRIARQKNVDVSQVNFSKVKVRMLPKENLKSTVENPSESSRKTVAEKCKIDTEVTREFEKENFLNSNKGEKRKFNETEVKRKKKRTRDEIHDESKAHSVKNEDDDDDDDDEEITEKIFPSVKRRTKQRRSYSTFTSRRQTSIRLKKKLPKMEEAFRIAAQSINTCEDVNSVVGYFSEKSLINQQAKHRNLKKVLNQNRKPKAVVVLKDLKSVLPQEAFGGKAVSAVKIEGNINQQSFPKDSFVNHFSGISPSLWTNPSHHSTPVQSERGAHSSPLQFIFNTLSNSHQPEGGVYSAPTYPLEPQSTNEANLDEDIVPSSVHVRGRCMVCGFNYLVSKNFWHNIEEDIKPPILMVPVRWVCVSLNVAPVQLTQRDRDEGKVCRHCFVRLAKQFEIFVRTKVGESCGMSPEAVVLSEYLISFNPSTMNIEADPKQHSLVQEFEDVGELLMKILPVIQRFSIDDVVGRYHRQPLKMQDFSVWMLLVLNDLRIQIGASIGDLAAWLTRLMPSEMYDKGLRLCESNLASFLLNITKFSDTLTEDKLSAGIPREVFTLEGQSQNAQFTTGDVPTESSTQNNGNVSSYQQNGEDSQINCVENDVLDKDELEWEDFLECLNLDKLMKGVAKPLSVKQFNNGILYSLWRVSQIIGEGDHVVIDWLRQLSPVPLQEEQLRKLVSAVGPLHKHLEECPEDIRSLKCEIIPQLKCDENLLTQDQQVHSFPYESKIKKMQIQHKEANSSSLNSLPRVSNKEVKNDSRPLALQERNADKLEKLGSDISGITKRKRGRPRKRPLTLAETCLTTHQRSIDVSLETAPGLIENSNPSFGNKREDLTLNTSLLTSSSSVHPCEEIASHKTTVVLPERSTNGYGNKEENKSHLRSKADDYPPNLSSEKKNINRVPETDTIRRSVRQVAAKEKAKCNETKNNETNSSRGHNFEEQLPNSDVEQKSERKKSTNSSGSGESECGDITTEMIEEQGKLKTHWKQNTESEDRDHPYSDEDKGSESQQIQTMLVNKVKKLERELEELKKHSQKLMEANEKLVGVNADKTHEQTLHDQQKSTCTAIKNIENHLKAISQKGDTTHTPHNPSTGMSRLTESSINDLSKGHPSRKLKYKKRKRKSIKKSQKPPFPVKYEHSERGYLLKSAQVGLESTPESHKTPQVVKSHTDLKSNLLKKGSVSQFPKAGKQMEDATGTPHKELTDMLPKSSLDMTTKSTGDNGDVNLKHIESRVKNYVDKKDEKSPEKQCKTKVLENCNSESSLLEKNSPPVSENAGIYITKLSAKTLKEGIKPSSVVIQNTEKSLADLKCKSVKTVTPAQVQRDKSKVSGKVHGSSKKPKPSFEELMNYDVGH